MSKSLPNSLISLFPLSWQIATASLLIFLYSSPFLFQAVFHVIVEVFWAGGRKNTSMHVCLHTYIKAHLVLIVTVPRERSVVPHFLVAYRAVRAPQPVV